MKKYALVVGISSYTDPEILGPVVRCPRHAGGRAAPGRRVRVRSGPHIGLRGRREPDHTNIVDALHNLAPCSPRRTCSLLFCRPRHRDQDGGPLCSRRTPACACPSWASLSKEVLSDCLARIECANRVLILDACRNDPHQGRGDEDNVLTSGFSRDIMAVADTAVEGVVPVTCVLFSCRPGRRRLRVA